MKGEKKRGLFSSVILAFFVCCFFIVGIFLFLYSIRFHPTIAIAPLDIFDKTLVIGAHIDSPPYTFISKDGSPSGHDIELIYYLCNILNYNVEVRFLDWSDALDALRTGSINVLLTVSHTPERAETFSFTTPIISTTYRLFTAKSKTPVSPFYGEKLCALENDSIKDSFLIPYKLDQKVMYYTSYTEAFQSVLKGENSAVIAPYMTGKRIAADLGAKSITASRQIIADAIFCMAVQKENAELLAQLDSGLEQLYSDKTLTMLNKKWFKNYVDITSFKDLININSTGILALLLVCTLLMVSALATLYVLLKKNETRACLNEQCFRALAKQSKKVVIEWDCKKNNITDISNFGEIFGRNIVTYNATKEMVVRQITHSEDAGAFLYVFDKITCGEKVPPERIRVRDADGKYNWCLLCGITINEKDGTPYKAIASIENIDMQVRKEDYLRQKAALDILTGLNNKTSTKILIDNMISAQLPDTKSALICADLDNFKKINDTFGHLFGDKVLIETAEKIQQHFRSSDILGRFGGDEFVFYIHDIPDKSFIAEKAASLNKSIDCTYTRNETSLNISVSMGIALFPQDGTTYDELYKKADEASYRAKNNGKNCFFFYSE